MAAIVKSDSQLADKSSNPLIGVRQSNVSDVTATTTAAISAPAAAAVSIVYATDEPSITPDGSINIADGDATLNNTEIFTAIEELMTPINLMVTLTTELRVDHATILADIANVRTTIASILDVLEEHGLMVAT